MASSENLTVMFTDIANFSERTQEMSRAEAARFLRHHEAIVAATIKRFNGHHVKTIGDSFLAVFRSSTDAVICAMAIHDTLHLYNSSVKIEERIVLRVALNVGDVSRGNRDIFGPPVNIASRLEGVTPPGEIYLTEAVFMTMNQAEVPIEFVNPLVFPGVKDEIRVFRVPPYVNTSRMSKFSGSNDTGELLDYPFGGAFVDESLAVVRKTRRSKWLLAIVFALFGACLCLFLLPGLWSQNQMSELEVPQRSLAIWLDAGSFASKGGGVEWRDRRGADLPAAVQSDYSRAPTLVTPENLPRLHFDGDDFLILDSYAPEIHGGDGVSVFLVAAAELKEKVGTENWMNFGYLLSMQNRRDGDATDFFRIGYRDFNPFLTLAKKKHFPRRPLMRESKLHIVSMTLSKDKIARMYFNGKEVLQARNRSELGQDQVSQISVGQEWDEHSPSNFYKGMLAELLLYKRILNYRERETVEKYLSRKYKIKL